MSFQVTRDCRFCQRPFTRIIYPSTKPGHMVACSRECAKAIPMIDRFFEHVGPKQPNGCILWTGSTFNGGYGRIWSDGKSLQTHRVSYELFIGLIPDGLCVCHRCDTPLCIRPSCFFLGTSQENTADKVAKGRQARTRGESSRNAKLTTEQVLEIRRLGSLGATQQAIAELFHISRGHVGLVISKRRWAHV